LHKSYASDLKDSQKRGQQKSPGAKRITFFAAGLLPVVLLVAAGFLPRLKLLQDTNFGC
jgi:hypothetical protein